MTTIAFKAGILAGDSLVRSDDYARLKTVQKVISHRDDLFFTAIVGGRPEGLHARRAFEEAFVNDPHPPLPILSDIDFKPLMLIVVVNGDLFTYSCPTPEFHGRDAVMAFGSGWQFAMGAMRAGASAKKAVEIACGLDLGSDYPVTAIDTRVKKKKK